MSPLLAIGFDKLPYNILKLANKNAYLLMIA